MGATSTVVPLAAPTTTRTQHEVAQGDMPMPQFGQIQRTGPTRPAGGRMRQRAGMAQLQPGRTAGLGGSPRQRVF